MSSRRPISWSAALRDLHADRLTVPVGFLTARHRIVALAGFRKTPLFAAGRFDRSTIMALAIDAARDHQGRYGATWVESMSIGLKAAWQAAKAVRNAAVP